MTNYWIILFLSISSTFLQAQPTVTGTVQSSEGETLIGVNIYYPGIDNGTISQMDGSFEIGFYPNEPLIFSYLNFIADTIILLSNDPLQIILREKPITEQIPGIVITPEAFLQPNHFVRVTGKNLENIQVLSPQHLYNSIPGIFMHSGAPNTNRLTIRGIGSRSAFATSKIRAYFNDIPLTDGIGESNLEDLNFSFIDEIEITKGPSAPEYGTSLGGIIHYKTKTEDQKGLRYKGAFQYGAFETAGINNTISYSNEKWNVRINQDLLSSAGYRENNNYLRQNYTAYASYEHNQSTWSLFYNSILLKAEIPSALSYLDFLNRPEIAAPNWAAVNGNEQYQRHQFSLAHRKETNRFTSKTAIFTTLFDSNERRPFNTLLIDRIQYGIKNMNEHRFDNTSFRIAYGLEAILEEDDNDTFETLEEARGNRINQTKENRLLANVYLQSSYEWRKFSWKGGLNLNNTRYQFFDFHLSNGDQSGTFQFNPILSPYLAMHYRPRNLVHFYSSISSGFSTPSFMETQDENGNINTDIRPERGTNIEIGYRQRWKEWEWDLSLYSMTVSDLLVQERITEDITVAVNAGQTWHPGIEAGVQYHKIFKENTIDQWHNNLSFQYAPHRFINFTNDGEVFDQKFLPGLPQTKISLESILRIGIFQPRIQYQYIGGMFIDDANSFQTDAYSLLHFQLDMLLGKGSKLPIQLYVQVNNVLNQQYISMIAVNPRSFGSPFPRFAYPGLPRHFMLGANIDFEL